MNISVLVHSQTSVTVTRTPGFFARLLGYEETTRFARLVKVSPVQSEWFYPDDREVEPDTAEAIERAVTEYVARQRQEAIRWRR